MTKVHLLSVLVLVISLCWGTGVLAQTVAPGDTVTESAVTPGTPEVDVGVVVDPPASIEIGVTVVNDVQVDLAIGVTVVPEIDVAIGVTVVPEVDVAIGNVTVVPEVDVDVDIDVHADVNQTCACALGPSPESTAEVIVSLIDIFNGSFDVIWIDEAGVEQVHTTIVDGQDYNLTTYVGHQWLVRDTVTSEVLLVDGVCPFIVSDVTYQEVTITKPATIVEVLIPSPELPIGEIPLPCEEEVLPEAELPESDIELPSEDCKTTRSGSDYAGEMTYNEDDDTCQRWDSQSPNEHDYNTDDLFPNDDSVKDAANYCRDAGYGGKGPWCYHADDSGWDYCDVPYCASEDCKLTEEGDEYVGDVSETEDGHECQRWDSQSPNDHSYDNDRDFPYDDSVEDAANYCRRAGGDGDAPWCYHADDEDWDYCHVIVCASEDCLRTDEGTEYVGTVSEHEEGVTCQRWDSQSPNEHDYNTPDLFPYDDSVEDAENYCRQAGYGDDGPWCYDVEGSWDYCDIPDC